MLLVLLASACTHPASPAGKPNSSGDPEIAGHTFSGARLSEAEVTRLARQCAKRDGIRLRDYRSPKVTFKVRRGTPTWVVSFERDAEYQYPGSCFDVFVDDQTAEAILVRCE